MTNFQRTSFLRLLVMLMPCLSYQLTEAQDSSLQAKNKILIGPVEKAKNNFSGNLFPVRSHGGTLSYHLNTNSGYNYSNQLPPFFHQVRLNYGFSIFNLPLKAGAQYGFGNRSYSGDYFFITIDESRLQELKKLKQTPLQKLKNTADSLQVWNNSALDRLKSCETELDKIKNTKEFDQIREYETISQTFADSFEFLDSSRMKALFAKRKELEKIRDNYNTYRQLKLQKQNLLEGYNSNIDSLQKLKDQELQVAGLNKKYPDKELKKLNFGLVQPVNGLQTSYAQPIRGLNLAYQYGIWYSEIVVGTSLKAKVGIPTDRAENLLQFLAGIKTKEQELLIHTTRITSRSNGKLLTPPNEQTTNLGVRAMKAMGKFRIEGDASTDYYRNNVLSEGFDYSELPDSLGINISNKVKPAYNYALKGMYTGDYFRFKLGHSHQGQAWSFGTLSLPAQDLSRYNAEAGIRLFEGIIDWDFSGNLTKRSKSLKSNNKTYVVSSGIKWKINSFNTLVARHQYVVSGSPISRVEQNISTLVYSNVSRLFGKPLVNGLSILRHELMSTFSYQQNYNLIFNSALRMAEYLNLTFMAQKFMAVQKNSSRNQTTLQIGCQGVVKEFTYHMNVGGSTATTGSSFTGRAGIAWQSLKKPFAASFNCTYSQLINSEILNMNNIGEIGQMNSPVNLLTNLSLMYKL